MAAPLYTYNTTNYTLSLSAQPHYEATGKQPLPSSPKASIMLQLGHTGRWCSNSIDCQLPVDRFSDLGLTNFSFETDLSGLLFPHSIEKAVHEILASAFIKQSACKLLSCHISTFAHYAAMEAAKRSDIMGLDIAAKVGVNVIFPNNNNEGISAAIVGSQLQAQRSQLCPSVQHPEQLCSLCLAELCNADGTELVVMACSHAFHQRCIQQWTQLSSSCPVCRSNAA